MRINDPQIMAAVDSENNMSNGEVPSEAETREL